MKKHGKLSPSSRINKKRESEHLIEKNLLMNILQDGQQAFDTKIILKSRR